MSVYSLIIILLIQVEIIISLTLIEVIISKILVIIFYNLFIYAYYLFTI
jgi:hypothetical protein